MRGENPIRRFARGGDGLSRREVVQRLIGTAGGSAALVTLGPLANAAEGKTGSDADPSRQSATQQAAAPSTAEWSPQFLDAHQNETLTLLAERIIPGSGRAQVNRTIDLLLTVETQASQRNFLEALSGFDGEALRLHRLPFVSLSEEQQIAILTTASTGEASRKDSDSDGDWDPWSGPSSSATSASESTLTLRDHFEIVKGWVGRAYYSSEAGLRDLGWTGRVMWDSWPSCKHPDGHA